MGLGLISDYNQFSTVSLAVSSKIPDVHCGLYPKSGLIQAYTLRNSAVLEQQAIQQILFRLPVINSLDLHSLGVQHYAQVFPGML